jgi:spermidine/putrescine transport system permease protein
LSAIAERAAQRAPTPRRAHGRRRWTRVLLPTYTGAVIFYLTSPILVMILFGFNDTKGRFNLSWQGFTIEWYRQLLGIPDLTSALKNSLLIAAFSTVVATILGTMIALALARHRFHGQSSTNLILFMNIAAPEVVLGAALLGIFITLQVPLGFLTIFLAHVMFNIAFVAVTVRARLSGMDTSLEEAAQDLGATPWITFWLVTLPLIFPGVLAGGLLAFALSIDDYVITSFISGQTITFPLWVYGASRLGIPPQVNVMGTLIFLFGVTLAFGNILLNRRASGEARGVVPEEEPDPALRTAAAASVGAR